MPFRRIGGGWFVYGWLHETFVFSQQTEPLKDGCAAALEKTRLGRGGVWKCLFSIVHDDETQYVVYIRDVDIFRTSTKKENPLHVNEINRNPPPPP